MSGDCKCQFKPKSGYDSSHYSRRAYIQKLKAIASFLGISNAELDLCNLNLAGLISIIRRRNSANGSRWAFLKAAYTGVDYTSVLAKLSKSGNTSLLQKVMELSNGGCSASSVESYVDELIKVQNKGKNPSFRVLA